MGMNMNKDIGIYDIRLTSSILSEKLTTKPEERLSGKNVETIFDTIREKISRQRG